MKKRIIGLLATTAVLFTIAGCKGKTTKTNKVTSPTTTTAKPTTTEDKSLKYRVSKETFDSFFSLTIDEALKLNFTCVEIINRESYGLSNTTRTSKFDNTRMSDYDGQFHVELEKTDDGKIKKTYYEYLQSLDMWNKIHSSPVSTYDLNGFMCLTAHRPTLDYSKLVFDKTTNSYSYNGNATIYCQVNDSYTIMEYSNIVLKFEDDLLISISFHSIENEYSDPDYENKTSTSETNKSFTFSNYGTTSVEHINTN